MRAESSRGRRARRQRLCGPDCGLPVRWNVGDLFRPPAFRMPQVECLLEPQPVIRCFPILLVGSGPFVAVLLRETPGLPGPGGTAAPVSLATPAARLAPACGVSASALLGATQTRAAQAARWQAAIPQWCWGEEE
jgi:hypothetical protein